MAGSMQQAVGSQYALESMQFARDKTWQVVNRVAELVRPGMLESEATTQCKAVLEELGMDRIWHPVLIRFGENTLRTFKQRSVGDPRLKENDIFFIDLGVVWDRHEGDAGATFVVGSDPEMKACADAAKSVFDEVEHHWRSTGAGGKALYDYAAGRASALGWRLNLEIKGHRVSDFPHAIYRAGDLGDFAPCPDAGLWILEIQLAHPTRPFGAFYEDLLI
ncbi:M24 family metallopeptidase [Cupriavidus basilensis]|uniref:M24 family metallopeptidase n=1 Tax=Cupriavidus basilensis TaxID=68895 RepID=A0ABT6AIK3_9BURK|nr:M24 family metallopeptidase [Cupriavidus basilensis]MDF3832137.1 M24 family metallopeptidase [Cupriavidus basilensis]